MSVLSHLCVTFLNYLVSCSGPLVSVTLGSVVTTFIYVRPSEKKLHFIHHNVITFIQANMYFENYVVVIFSIKY